MTRDEAMKLICAALDETKLGLSAKVTEDTDLIAESLIDSLDSMNFLFELETQFGGKLTAIDESYSDFRIIKLIDILVEA